MRCWIAFGHVVRGVGVVSNMIAAPPKNEQAYLSSGSAKSISSWYVCVYLIEVANVEAVVVFLLSRSRQREGQHMHPCGITQSVNTNGRKEDDITKDTNDCKGSSPAREHGGCFLVHSR